ncbi:DGQHR domain-containing protein [Limnospira indica]|uniref:DGQHR domain-containing protein n=1 Tax=Limnospira indica TaxID=147322 RepID=UPI00061A9668|nr:DGQHR domain-containing protein [Limnospira indica]QNH57909.1 MAG: DGQHR domain-containing protein [Limnospira indica BM01]
MTIARNPKTEGQPGELGQLLTELLNNSDRILVQPTSMGVTQGYIGAVSLEWAASHIGYASELPLFKSHIDPETQNIERGAETIDAILQRPLDWSRQAILVQYLITHNWDRKFPPLVVVISPHWVDNPQAPQWDKNGQATCSAAEYIPLDEHGKIGILDLSSSVSVFALDGQHRLMGIQGVIELLTTRKIQPYSKLKKPVGEPITWDKLPIVNMHPQDKLAALNHETIGIEFIPAVLAGETRQQAQRRIRSIFVHLNQMAVKLSKGQLAALDENDGFSIVCRQVAVNHPLLQDEPGRKPRINWDSATVATKSTVLTTLQALRDMAELYLGCYPKFRGWKAPQPGLVPYRPEPEELALGTQELMSLFDGLASLPSYQKLTQGMETPDLRRFGFERPPGLGNILFRPVGQIAIAHGIGKVVFHYQQPLETVFKKLVKFDAEGGFNHIEYPQSIWYGVLYDPNKRRVRVAGRSLATDLIVYLLGEITELMDEAIIRKQLAEARTFENRAINFEGRIVKPREVGLPDPIDL